MSAIEIRDPDAAHRATPDHRLDPCTRVHRDAARTGMPGRVRVGARVDHADAGYAGIGQRESGLVGLVVIDE